MRRLFVTKYCSSMENNTHRKGMALIMVCLAIVCFPWMFLNGSHLVFGSIWGITTISRLVIDSWQL